MSTVEKVSIDTHVTQKDANGIIELLDVGVAGTISHDARLNMIRTRIVTSADLTLVSAAGAAAKGGGVKLFTIRSGVAVQPLWASVRGRLNLSAATATSTAGELGLGSVICSGAVATLATATFEDMLQGGVPAMSNIVAGGTIGQASIEGLRTAHIGTGAATSVFLNAASTFAVATTDLVFQSGGIIEMCWAYIPTT